MVQKRKPGRPRTNVPGARKSRKPANVKGPVAQELMKLVEERASDWTAEVNRILVEYLERIGRWPPPASGSK